MVDNNIDNEKQSTSAVGHLDGHGNGPVQYEVHCLM